MVLVDVTQVATSAYHVHVPDAATSLMSRPFCSAMKPSTGKMTKPDRKLVALLTAAYDRQSLHTH